MGDKGKKDKSNKPKLSIKEKKELIDAQDVVTAVALLAGRNVL